MPMSHRFTANDQFPALLNGAFMFFTAATNFFLPIYFKDELGFSGGQIGLLFAAQATTGVLAALPAGLGNDRLSSRLLVALGLLFQGVTFALMAVFHSYWVFFAVFFVWALAYNLYRISFDVQVLKACQGVGLSRRMLIFQLYRFLTLAAGTVLAGYLLTNVSFSAALIATALACILLSALAMRLEPTPLARLRLADYTADLRRPEVLFFALWMFLFATHWGAEYTCYGLFLRNGLGLSLAGLGVYMTGEFAMIAIVFLVLLKGGRTFDRPRLTRLAIWGLISSGVGQIGMIFQPVSISFAFRLLHGIGDGLMFVILYLGIASLFVVQRIGGNTGFVNLAAMLGLVVGSLIFGPLGERMGYDVPLWSSGVITMVLALPLMRRSKKPATAGAAEAIVNG